ncbi:hypothetical protein T10_3366 [Trichinella papuae]|uniref:Uncharacterized protein n=1 Tax=Trichinella papuae TaxID=268474 RepID=A0A0V1MQH1_9BILA|nr:hypothetical protein T10_3366 [Trichinella papuae]
MSIFINASTSALKIKRTIHSTAERFARFTQAGDRHVNQANARSAMANAEMPPQQSDLHALPRPVLATLIKRTLSPLKITPPSHAGDRHVNQANARSAMANAAMPR